MRGQSYGLWPYGRNPIRPMAIRPNVWPMAIRPNVWPFIRPGRMADGHTAKRMAVHTAERMADVDTADSHMAGFSTAKRTCATIHYT